MSQAADKKKKSGTYIERCNCKSDFQDKTHGLGMRVHNYAANGKKKGTCTVCGREKQ